uniref:Coagulation factor XIII B chain n=1 Tax=Cyanoderma ruficeps TaxID=181631 RepID=A0A8C3QYM5_9PASS
MAAFKAYLRETLAYPLQNEQFTSRLCFIPWRAVPGAPAPPRQLRGSGAGGAGERDAAVPLRARLSHRGRERLRGRPVPRTRLGPHPQLHQYVLPSQNSPVLHIKMGKEPSFLSWWRELSSIGFRRCVFHPGITCSALSEVAHGSFYPVKKIYEEGDVVHFFCDKHYSVTGFDSIQCYNFGWYPDPPVCEDVKNKCPPPPLPRGHISTARRTYHNGDKVSVQCTLGRTGSEEIRCEGGKWTSPSNCIGTVDEQESGASPPLEADAEIRASQTHPSEVTKMQHDCASPPVIKNGDILGPLLANYKNGSWVEYACQHYHVLDGPSTVYCDHGNWTEQPTCLEPCTLNVTDMDSNNLTLKWRREELIFLHGDLIEFECKQGYAFLHTAIPSPGRTQCDHGRLKYPKCVIQAATEKCGSPPSVANGALTLPALPQYDSGSSVQYICSDYHFLQGSERIYCSEGQWTLPPVCIEPCTLSKTEMENNNVLLQAFYADQVYFYHGDYVGFYCKQNHFGADSGTTLFQVQCKRGQLAYPRCVERGK